MTFIDAIMAIATSRTYNAAKRPAMGGYVFRSEVSTVDPIAQALAGSGSTTAGDYTLTFRKRADDTSGATPTPVDYVYSYNASTGIWTAPAVKPDLDGELFGELLGDDWQIGKAEDFERARTGGAGDNW